eukprot:3305574-Rhodomonas_salina.2
MVCNGFQHGGRPQPHVQVRVVCARHEEAHTPLASLALQLHVERDQELEAKGSSHHLHHSDNTQGALDYLGPSSLEEESRENTSWTAAATAGSALRSPPVELPAPGASLWCGTSCPCTGEGESKRIGRDG